MGNWVCGLKAFKAREGHCRVGASHIEGDFKLGFWVSTQRRKKNKMSDERKQRLDDTGFVWRANARAKFRPRSGPRPIRCVCARFESLADIVAACEAFTFSASREFL